MELNLKRQTNVLKINKSLWSRTVCYKLYRIYALKWIQDNNPYRMCAASEFSAPKTICVKPFELHCDEWWVCVLHCVTKSTYKIESNAALFHVATRRRSVRSEWVVGRFKLIQLKNVSLNSVRPWCHTTKCHMSLHGIRHNLVGALCYTVRHIYSLV